MNLSKLKTVLADAVSADADTGVTVLLPGEALSIRSVTRTRYLPSELKPFS